MGEGLKVYVGPKTQCGYCGQPFTEGQRITVSNGGGLVFCSFDEGHRCLLEHVRRSPAGRLHIGDPMWYRVSGEEPEAPAAEPAEGFLSRIGWGIGHVLYWVTLAWVVAPVMVYAMLRIDPGLMAAIACVLVLMGWGANVVAGEFIGGTWSYPLFFGVVIGVPYVFGWWFLIAHVRDHDTMFCRFRERMKHAIAERRRNR